MTVKQWVAVGIAAAAVITELVLVFVQPLSAVFAGGGFVLGGVTGYLLKKNNIVNTANANEEKAEK